MLYINTALHSLLSKRKVYVLSTSFLRPMRPCVKSGCVFRFEVNKAKTWHTSHSFIQQLTVIQVIAIQT